MSASDTVGVLQTVVASPISLASGLVGRVDGDSFAIRWRTLMWRNDFNSILVGRVVDAPFGSIITAILRPTRFAVIFMAIWVAIAAFVALAFATAPGGGGTGPLPFIFPVFGVVLFALGRLMASRGEVRIVAQLDALFDVAVEEPTANA